MVNDMITDELREALESAKRSIVFDSMDYGISKRHAWLYGILVGWDDEEEIGDKLDAMSELAEKFGWDDATVARLRRYRSAIKCVQDIPSPKEA